MRIQRLLNFSTHAGEPDLFDDDWSKIDAFLQKHQFDGFELYPVGGYDFDRIPPELIRGLHLRFFVMLRQIWQGNDKELLAIFDNWDNIERFYGGRTRQIVVDTYVYQLDLAQKLGCDYVVFHPVHCELDHVFDWKFPYDWRDTLQICAEILNEALARSSFSGWLLFENLWWPGSFRLEEKEEYEFLREQVNYHRCGITLDTGHLLNASGGFSRESEAIDYLCDRLAAMGDQAADIRTIHLTLSLSGNYIRQSRKNGVRFTGDFWQRLSTARQHVSQIDPHDPFTDPAIGRILDYCQPSQVVFEFTFKGLEIWEENIGKQKKAMARLWEKS